MPECFDMLKIAKEAYGKGENVIQKLRKINREVSRLSDSEIIEISYDLQAGSYSSFAKMNKEWFEAFSNEVASIITDYTDNCSSLLDAGCGELTTTAHIINKLTFIPEKIFALELSLSRLSAGIQFWRENCHFPERLKPFCANMTQIPLQSNQVDIALTVHALEPNKEGLRDALRELFRVTKKYLFLFEPCFERSDYSSKKRMLKHNYIQNLENEVITLGGNILDIKRIKNPANENNPTFCFIVNPPVTSQIDCSKKNEFSLPGTENTLTKFENYFYSKDTGLLFPIINGIPILKSDKGILANFLTNCSK